MCISEKLLEIEFIFKFPIDPETIAVLLIFTKTTLLEMACRLLRQHFKYYIFFNSLHYKYLPFLAHYDKH